MEQDRGEEAIIHEVIAASLADTRRTKGILYNAAASLAQREDHLTIAHGLAACSLKADPLGPKSLVAKSTMIETEEHAQ